MKGSIEATVRYGRALMRLLPLYEKQNFTKRDMDTIEVLKKAIILLVKFLNNKPYPTACTVDQAQADFNYFENVKKNMALLTPYEFINLFPITKNYDGEKYGIKDYFCANKDLKKYDSAQPLGDKIEDFLWDYWNEDINEFMAQSMMAASRLMKAQSGQSLFETFLKPIGAGVGKPIKLRVGVGKDIEIKAGAGNEKMAIRSSITPPGVRTKLPNYLRVIK
jgi:hypothetical protein